MKIDIEMGYILILAGIVFLWFTFKYPEKEGDSTALNFRSVLWAVVIIVIGVLMLFDFLPPMNLE